MGKVVPYIVVTPGDNEPVVCTSKAGVARLLGVSVVTLDRRFVWVRRDEYKGWVVWTSPTVHSQRKGFGIKKGGR